ncbi:MFS transporter small subunit [Streptomyces reniochalinae]|nr:hypothetical protein [Streptomyces reniochalinae]
MAPSSASPEPAAPRRTWLAVLVWLWVGLPFAYGLYELVLKATQLFTD